MSGRATWPQSREAFTNQRDAIANRNRLHARVHRRVDLVRQRRGNLCRTQIAGDIDRDASPRGPVGVEYEVDRRYAQRLHRYHLIFRQLARIVDHNDRASIELVDHLVTGVGRIRIDDEEVAVSDRIGRHNVVAQRIGWIEECVQTLLDFDPCVELECMQYPVIVLDRKP